MRFLGAVVAIAVLCVLPAVSGCSKSSEVEGTAPERVSGRLLVGISEPNAWRALQPKATADQIASYLKRLGVSAHRWVVDWSLVERTPPAGGTHRYDFSRFDEMYQADVRAGIRPFVQLLNAPDWAANAEEARGPYANPPPAPDHLADWGDFAAAVAERYPKAVAIEVWNEPNLTTFWGTQSSETPPDPARYTELLKVAYDAIKEVRPDLPVVGGALSSNENTSPGGNISYVDFLRGMLRDGAAAHMDGVSIHAYPRGQGLDRVGLVLGTVRDELARAGYPMPIWLTETGLSTEGEFAVDPEAQGEGLVAIYKEVRRMGDVEAMFIHNLVPSELDPHAEGSGYALLGQAQPGAPLRPKPAFFALRRALRGQ
ncbi:MAG: GH39 family glycosyl hydrolase [Solirubrobacterales bacterium]